MIRFVLQCEKGLTIIHRQEDVIPTNNNKNKQNLTWSSILKECASLSPDIVDNRYNDGGIRTEYPTSSIPNVVTALIFIFNNICWDWTAPHYLHLPPRHWNHPALDNTPLHKPTSEIFIFCRVWLFYIINSSTLVQTISYFKKN